MKRAVAFLTAVLVAASVVMPATVSAASIGSCISGSPSSYISGEGFTGTRNGISATTYVPVSTFGWFGPCSPNDNLSVNASASIIGVSYGGTVWFEEGIIACNHSDINGWPASLCDGNPHWFVEQHGAAFWDYNMWDKGIVAANVTWAMTVSYVSTQHQWRAKFGSQFFDFDMGNGLIPGQNQNAWYWQGETHDAHDGLGNNISGQSLSIGNMQTLSGTTWSFRNVLGACDVVSPEHHCVPNGNYAIYLYTTQ